MEEHIPVNKFSQANRFFFLTINVVLIVFLAGCAAPTPPVVKTPAPKPAPSIAKIVPQAPATGALSGDLWSRIRGGYAMPNLESDLVRDREIWYTSRPDYIQRMTERSSKYLFYVVEELERRRMPSELALLPFIESAFNPQAMSHAKASGMWQFMPATGRHFSLKQNMFRDDRRDVLASTRAALDYLQKLHGMFGDWHLALAAYNWGEGSVSRAIVKNQSMGLGTGYLDLSMPNETRYYVPKLQAIKNILANPTQYGATLPHIANHPYFQAVNITRDIDVTMAAKLAEVSLEDFKALNPSANRPVIMASGTPQVLLPWDSAVVFQRNLENYRGQLATWTAWTAPSTMRTADVARRAGIAESELRSMNKIPPNMLLKAGSTVLIPRAAHMDTDVASNVADNASLAFTPEIIIHHLTVHAHKRDTIARIAARYGMNATSVAVWNDRSATAKLKAGQAVVLHVSARAGSHPTLIARADPPEPRSTKLKRKVSKRNHAIDDGDDDEDEKPVKSAKAKPGKSGKKA